MAKHAMEIHGPFIRGDFLSQNRLGKIALGLTWGFFRVIHIRDAVHERHRFRRMLIGRRVLNRGGKLHRRVLASRYAEYFVRKFFILRYRFRNGVRLLLDGDIGGFLKGGLGFVLLGELFFVHIWLLSIIGSQFDGQLRRQLPALSGRQSMPEQREWHSLRRHR